MGWRCPRGVWPRGGGTGNERQQKGLRGRYQTRKFPGDGGEELPQGTLCGAGAGPGELEEGPGNPGKLRPVLRDVARRQGHTALPVRLCLLSQYHPYFPAPGESGLRWGTPALGPPCALGMGTAVAPGTCSPSAAPSAAPVPVLRKNNPRAHHPLALPLRSWPGRAGLCRSQHLH